jgi:hypothetical protein
LPSTPATVRKSFRPTASRTRGTQKQNQNQTQISCACRSPMEKTLEADISSLRKTGHFYFALTRIVNANCERGLSQFVINEGAIRRRAAPVHSLLQHQLPGEEVVIDRLRYCLSLRCHFFAHGPAYDKPFSSNRYSVNNVAIKLER